MKLNNIKLIVILCATAFISCEQKVLEKCDVVVNQDIATKDGKRYHGTCLIYTQDTILYRKLTYKRGYLRKEIAYYPTNGAIEYIGFRKKGKINGEFNSFYENGEKSIEGNVDMGIFIGEWRYYDDDGTLNKIVKYDEKGTETETINMK